MSHTISLIWARCSALMTTVLGILPPGEVSGGYPEFLTVALTGN
ncbi:MULTISPECIES: hypothetical protein [Streptomyces]|nr:MULTISPECIES: hypothetical protein [Streptomyces]